MPTASTAWITAVRPDPQTRLTVSAGTSMGTPALIAAWRATFMPCPACNTQPSTTSPTSLCGTAARAIASSTTIAPRSAAEISLSVPPKLAMGVRQALRMTASSEAANGFLDLQRRAGGGANGFNSGVFGDLAQNETIGCDVDHSQLGDDLVHDLHAGQRQRAFAKDLVFPILRRVFHRHDHFLG